MKISVPLEWCPAQGQCTIKIICPFHGSAHAKPLCNLSRIQHIKWVMELVCVFCHSALRLCIEKKMQTASDERGEGGNENVKSGKKLLNGTNCLGKVCVYSCAACLPQSIIRKDKPPREEWLPYVGRMERPPSWTAHGNSTLALDCQFTGFTVIWLLSMADPEIAVHRASWPSNPANNLAKSKFRG